MSRPTKRTPETITRLLEGLRAGLTRGAACGRAGISDETLANWTRGKTNLGFLEQVREAESLAAARYEGVILDAARADPRYALEWLKRRRRDDWSEKTQTEITGAAGTPLQIVIVEKTLSDANN